MKTEEKKIMSSVFYLIIFSHYFNPVFSLSLSRQPHHNLKKESPHSGSRQSRQILPTSAILLPNVGQYLALIQILVLKLVIWTQIMRLLGQDYVGKGIKSTVPLSEQQDLDEILDYDDLEADIDLSEKKKKRKKRTIHRNYGNTRTYIQQINTDINIRILDKFRKIIELKSNSL